MHWLSPFFYMEAKFSTLEKNGKRRFASIEMKFLERTAGYTLFYHKSIEEILENMKVEPFYENLRSTNQSSYDMQQEGTTTVCQK
jgi:hypothetical protein